MIITVDFGGTRIKLGLVENGIVHAYQVIDSYSDDPFTRWIPRLREALLSLCSSADFPLADVEGMVWALPLIIDPGQRYATP